MQVVLVGGLTLTTQKSVLEREKRLDKVIEEEVEIDLLYELCGKFATAEGTVHSIPYRAPTSKAEALGWLGECAIEMYLSELCKDCDLLVDNRSTLRRYGVIMDLKSMQPICGDIHLQHELSAISEAVVRQGELRMYINPEMSIAIGSETHRITPGGSLRILNATKDHLTPFRNAKELMLSLVKKVLIEEKDEILSIVKEESSSYFNWITSVCGRLIAPNIFYFVSTPDVICIKLSEHLFHKEIPVTIELWTENRFEEIGRTSIMVNAKIGQIKELVLIGSKSSGKSLNPDPEIINEVKTRLSPFKKLGIQLNGYLLYLFYRRGNRRARIKLYKIL